MNTEEKQICTDSACNCKGMGLDQKTCEEILHHLRRAYCDEWLAFMQYWTAAQVVTGVMRPEMTCELMEHANEELADQYDYYYVPTIFYGEEKLYEASPAHSYNDIRENIRLAFDTMIRKES